MDEGGTLWDELTSPINIILTIAIVYMVKKLLESEDVYANPTVLDAPQPTIERDFTVSELKPYNGEEKPFILIGLNGNVYDVSARPDFYGLKGPYGLFAGRDASRALATGDLSGEALGDEFDDLTSLTEDERGAMIEWEQTYQMKYKRVGALVREHNPTTVSKSEKDVAEASKQCPESSSPTSTSSAKLAVNKAGLAATPSPSLSREWDIVDTDDLETNSQ
eukprot:CFRG3431T1